MTNHPFQTYTVNKSMRVNYELKIYIDIFTDGYIIS
jgi:hypothetical protein